MVTVEGIYRNGCVELLQQPVATHEARVLVTFLDAQEIDLPSRGINADQAIDLRTRLQTFAEDWDRPEMDVYDED